VDQGWADDAGLSSAATPELHPVSPDIDLSDRRAGW
jgi:hypothetical protein